MSKLRYTQSPEDKRKRSSSLLARGEEGTPTTTTTASSTAASRASKLRFCVSESEAGKDQQASSDMAEDGGGSSSPSSVSSSPTPDSTLSPEERKKKTGMRLDALLELFVSEREYVHDLDAAISAFVIPIRNSGIITEAQFSTMFSNIEFVFRTNQEFLRGLQDTFPDGISSIQGESQVGSVFVGMADYFKMYKIYCGAHRQGIALVDELTKTNPKFKELLDKCHADPSCRGLVLQSLLIKPASRVCKYPFLLKELLNNTPLDHPDYEPLAAVHTKISEIMESINEELRAQEGLQRIIDLQSRIDGLPSGLVEPGRKLHREGELSYHKSNTAKGDLLQAYLLSDLLVLAQPKSGRFEHKLWVSLDDCRLIVLADSPQIQNSFEIQQSQLKHKCILSLPTPNEQAQWVKDIKNCVKEFQKKKLRDLAEAKRRAAATSTSTAPGSPGTLLSPRGERGSPVSSTLATAAALAGGSSSSPASSPSPPPVQERNRESRDPALEGEKLSRRKSSSHTSRRSRQSDSPEGGVLEADADGSLDKKKRSSKSKRSSDAKLSKKSKSVDSEHRIHRRHSKSKLKSVSLDGEQINRAMDSTQDDEIEADETVWYRVIDPVTKSKFYCNSVSGQSAWDIPEKHTTTQCPERTRWWAIQDAESDDYYYYDTQTGDTTWNKPADVEFVVRIHSTLADEADSESDSDEEMTNGSPPQ